MWLYAIKLTVTVAIIVVAWKLAESKNTALAAIFLSLPLTSLLALVWTYVGTGDTQRISEMATGTFWMVIPSLSFFIVLPVLLRMKFHFSICMIGSCLVTAGCYFVTAKVLSMFGD